MKFKEILKIPLIIIGAILYIIGMTFSVIGIRCMLSEGSTLFYLKGHKIIYEGAVALNDNN